MNLFTYCLRYDDGAAPNPYHGTCTLVICKPAIRRAAKEGDWVVGLGSSHTPIGNVSGHVVYAMRVTQKVSLREYDTLCRSELPGKIPHWTSSDFVSRVGDCIYDFSKGAQPIMRRGVHTEANRDVDLGGKYALLSEHFYYFGDRPVPLPDSLLPIVHQTQGHKSTSNARYAHECIKWLEGLGLAPNGLYGEPQLKSELIGDPDCRAQCSSRDLEEDKTDEIC